MSNLDLGRLIRLTTEDFSFSANFGVFGGRASIAVFDNKAKGAPVIKVLFTETSLCLFKEMVERIIKDPEVKPVEIGIHPWDQDTKTNIFRSSITIGRDADKCIYFELVGDRHKEPVKMYTITDNAIRIGGTEIPKQQNTELGARAIIQAINTVIGAACVVTKTKYEGPRGGTKPASSEASKDMGEIPF